MKEPAHKILINQYLDWRLVRERLNRYKHIAMLFVWEDLSNCSFKKPFYCHYLAWRLGTWKSEQWFEFFDHILEICMGLPNWNDNRVPKGCEFNNFWSFIWELECAVFFANLPRADVQWTKVGPDLRVIVSDEEFYVECTSYHKSFGIEEFVNELFGYIYPRIRAVHVPFIQFSLPKDDKIETFLDSLFEPYLDPSFIQVKIEEAQRKSPVILPIPDGIQNFYVYLDAENPYDYNVGLPWVTAGDPESFLKVAFKEIIGNKSKSNKLKEHRPNLLAVNFLLGIDWQTAVALRPFVMPKLGTTLDGILITACGIDEIPTLEKLFINIQNNHPMTHLLKTM